MKIPAIATVTIVKKLGRDLALLEIEFDESEQLEVCAPVRVVAFDNGRTRWGDYGDK